MATSTWEAVRHALRLARERGFSEVSIGEGDWTFSATLSPTASVAPSTPEKTVNASEPGPELVEVGAPLVGYYHPAPKPLAVGADVSDGEIVAVIVALGLATEVESHVTGEVVEVCVEPQQAVEYGQVLARVRVTR